MEQEMITEETKDLRIRVNTIAGTSAEVEVKMTDSVQQFKEKIFNTLHIAPELQRITFKDKELEYGILEDYGLREGSSVTLSLVMKAGTASSTKRSLNIDQKSVSEIIRSLPQEQLSALLNQKKPVTITAKIGDHVVVFTLVPSDCSDSPSDKEQTPSSPSTPTDPSQQSSHHHHHHHHHRLSRSSHHQLIQHQPLPEEPIPVNLADKVSLIRKRLVSIRNAEEMDRQAVEQGQEARSKKQKRLHHQSRLFRRSKQNLKRTSSYAKERSSSSSSSPSPSSSEEIQQQQEQQEQEEATISDSPSCGGSDGMLGEKIECMSEPTTPMTELSNSEVIFSSPSEDLSSHGACLKCTKCSKKLKPTRSFTCKCGHVFCIDHRHQNLNLSSEKGHNCSFDFKTHGKEELRAANPLIQGPKIQHI